MLLELPPEILTRIFTLLDVTDVATLLEAFAAGQLDGLFQLITVNGEPPVFFPRRLTHVALEDYSTVLKGRVFMNLFEIQTPSDLGLRAAYSKLQDFPNFIAIVGHETLRSRSHFDMPTAIATLLPTSKVLISNIQSVRVSNAKPLASQNVAIEGCDRVAWNLCRHQKVYQPHMKKVSSLSIDNPSPELDTLADIDLETCPSDFFMVSYSEFPFDNTYGYVLKNKTIAAKRVLLISFTHIEGLHIGAKKLDLSPYEALPGQHPTITNINAPNLLELGIRTHHGSEPLVTRLTMPSLERFTYDNISGGDREEGDQVFLRQMDYIRDINTDLLQFVSFRSRNSDLFFKNASGFNNLTELEFVASEFHNAMTSKEFGEFPNLKKLEILLRFNDPSMKGRVPELKAPNLKFLYFHLYQGTIDDDDLSRVFASYTKLDQLKMSFIAAGDYVNIPQTLSLLNFCVNDLILVTTDFRNFINPESKFLRLISLSLTGFHGSDETVFSFKAPWLQRFHVFASGLGNLVRVENFPKLRTLTIGNRQNATVDNIELGELPLIEDIYLGVTPKKVKGGSMPLLKSLRLTVPVGTTAEEVIDFKEVHPKLVVRT